MASERYALKSPRSRGTAGAGVHIHQDTGRPGLGADHKQAGRDDQQQQSRDDDGEKQAVHLLSIGTVVNRSGKAGKVSSWVTGGVTTWCPSKLAWKLDEMKPGRRPIQCIPVSRQQTRTTMKPKAPCNDQTAEQLEAYYRKVQPGDVAVIRCTQGSLLRYLVDRVTETNPKKGRVYVEKGDAWAGQGFYMKSGKSTDAPTGQSNLIVPTKEVMRGSRIIRRSPVWVTRSRPARWTGTSPLRDKERGRTSPAA
jgi:hypothetical protein